MTNNHNWYATIQSRILCATDISANQKLLIALISNLSNAKGHCFASNEYLGKRLNIKKDSVRKLLTDLEDKGYINRVIKLRADYSVEYRHISVIERHDNPTTFDVEYEGNTPQDINTVPPRINITHTPGQISTTPQDESAYIITEVNNKDIKKEENLCIDINNSTINNIGNLDTIEDIIFWCSINDVSLGTNNPKYIIEDKWYLDKSYDEKELYLKKLTVQLQLN